MNNKEKAQEFINIATQLNTLGFFDVFVEYSQPENRILSVLYSTNDVSPSYLSDKLNLSRVNITISLNHLEKLGYIRREIDSHDRRKVICLLTEEGEKAITTLTDKATLYLANIFDKIGDDLSGSLVQIIKKIQDYYKL
ncbi:MAG TPA: MarR family winged helix-turn-helix transcriptional regulator [Bacilli bacterium]